jgi:predicted glycosyltransferase
VLAWIDIENPPQVQYLTPLRRAFQEAGVDVVVTARDMGATLALLRLDDIPFAAVGSGYGPRTVEKLAGVAVRTTRLLVHFAGSRRPDLLVCAGRAALLAARVLRRPAFSIWDYEHADMTFDRLARAYVLHPTSIGHEAFVERGIAPERLVAFEGLKEHITFARLDPASIDALELPRGTDGLVKVLFRPPADETHYYRAESGELSLRLLEYLSRSDAVLVFAPRYPRQTEALSRFEWAHRPVVLDQPVAFLPLLKSVDLVITSGGTMAREAAYLGIPAYSILRSEAGGVDRYLESVGRLRFVRGPEEFGTIELELRGPLQPLARSSDLSAELVARMLEITCSRR